MAVNPLSTLTVGNNSSIGSLASGGGSSHINGAGITLPATPPTITPTSSLLSGATGNITVPAPISPLKSTPVSSFGSALVPPSTTPTTPNHTAAATAPLVGGGTTTLPSGGTGTVDGAGNVISPTSFSINTSGTIPNTALGGNYTSADVGNTHSAYSQYVQQLAQASQYSPEYLAAYQNSQNSQVNQANIQGTLASNPAQFGETLGQAQGLAARQSNEAGAQTAYANVALQAQALARNGNIAAAQALVEGTKPVGVSPGSSLVSPADGSTAFGGSGAYSDYQAQQTYFNLAQNFPDAQIPSYNPQLSAQQNLQIAQQSAASSPSFQSRNLQFVTLPGGGVSAFNKNQIVTNPATGQYAIISPAQATAATAASGAIKTLTDQQAQISSQISTVDNNFPLLTNIVQKYGLNTGIPLQNQLQQQLGGALGSSAVTQLNAVAAGLKATIAQIVSRGGSVTESTRKEADSLLPTDVSYKVLEDLYKTVKAEGSGVVGGLNSEIQRQNTALNNIYSTGQSLDSLGGSAPGATGAGAAGSTNPFSAQSFFGGGK